MHRLGEKGIKALEDFNKGDLRGCHYTLEKLWVESKGEKKRYIQGIVQIIAAIFKIRRQPNWESAKRLLKKGLSRLEEIEPQKVEVDIERLIADAEELLSRIEELGPEEFTKIPDEALPKMHFINK